MCGNIGSLGKGFIFEGCAGRRARFFGSRISFCGVLFFFFQAEDGIRDKLVTGVQTCALPIYLDLMWAGDLVLAAAGTKPPGRSEERRVGKECRSRWSPYHKKKKKTK